VAACSSTPITRSIRSVIDSSSNGGIEDALSSVRVVVHQSRRSRTHAPVYSRRSGLMLNECRGGVGPDGAHLHQCTCASFRTVWARAHGGYFDVGPLVRRRGARPQQDPQGCAGPRLSKPSSIRTVLRSDAAENERHLKRGAFPASKRHRKAGRS
jgi:hypothetical protein